MGRFQDVKAVPNQRIVEVNKAATDKKNIYTTNNLSAIDEAAGELQSLAGFKLYIYLAKNQNKYTFALSSTDFERWACVSDTAYKTAFSELVEKGYLVYVTTLNKRNDCYAFYDKKQEQAEKEVTIIYPSAIGHEFEF